MFADYCLQNHLQIPNVAFVEVCASPVNQIIRDKVQKAFDLKNIEDMLDIVHRLYENYDESYCKEKYLKSKFFRLESMMG